MKIRSLLAASVFLGSVFIVSGCEDVVDPIVESCVVAPELARNPWLVASSAGHYKLRFETKTVGNYDGCVTVTLSDNTTEEALIISQVVTVDSPELSNSNNPDDDYDRPIYDAVLNVDDGGNWKLETVGDPVVGVIKPPALDEYKLVLMGDTNMVNTTGTTFITTTLLESAMKADPDAIVHAGDIVYNVYGDIWDNYFDVFGPHIANIPMIAAIGNHEYEFGQETAQYALPYVGAGIENADGGRVQVLDAGNLRVIAFDSNDEDIDEPEASEMWKAVDAALASAGDKMIALVFHHPIYTLSDHSPIMDLRSRVLAMDDKYDVNFVLTGHNHVYERFDIPDRFHTILSGGGGTFLYKLEGDDADSLAYLQKAKITYHYVAMSVDATSVTIAAYDLDEALIEKKTLLPK